MPAKGPFFPVPGIYHRFPAENRDFNRKPLPDLGYSFQLVNANCASKGMDLPEAISSAG
jgi:hypothetical protein